MNSSGDGGEHPILLYDGVCGLCNRLVQFTLRHDHKEQFRFAALQGAVAAKILARHGASPAEFDTFYLVTDPQQPQEQLWERSDAAIVVLDRLGGVWKLVAGVVRPLPRFIRDALYNLIARNRYRVFGKFDQCPLPDPRYRRRFLDG